MNKIPLAKQSELKFFAALFAVLFLTLLASYAVEKDLKEKVTQEQKVETPSPFNEVNLNAAAVYVYDVRTKTVLYAKSENKRLPLASLTKVMSALVAERLSRDGATLAIREEALKAEGDSGLKAGERWSLKTLLDMTLTSSSNDGAKALALAFGAMEKAEATPAEAEQSFVLEMNNTARELGMKDTYYFNETGLDETTQKGGAYGTAKDMAKLFEYILNESPNLLSATKEKQFEAVSLDGRALLVRNTDEVVGEIPGLKASKTGFTDIAGGNLVIAFDPELGRPIIVSVLGSSREARFSDVLALVEASLAAINTK